MAIKKQARSSVLLRGHSNIDLNRSRARRPITWAWSGNGTLSARHTQSSRKLCRNDPKRHGDFIGALECPMRHQASLELFRYWNRLRAGRAAPKRSEVSPTDISSVLPDAFILGVAKATVFRLAGTRLCATYGRELTGLPFRSLFIEDAQRLADRVVSGVAAEKSVAVIVFEAVSDSGRSLAFEMLLLPLDSGESQQCLGVVSPRDRPFWLGADPIKQATIISIRVIESRPGAHVRQEPPCVRDRSSGSLPSDEQGIWLCCPEAETVEPSRWLRRA